MPGTLGLGAFVSKTVTLNPREGNPPPRIAETPSGMINSIGLANPGVDRFCEHILPRLAELGVPLIVSVGGWSPHEYAVAVARIAADASVHAIELNVSCPNVESGCISIGTDATETRALVERCRARDGPAGARQALPERGRHRRHSRSRCRRRCGWVGGRKHVARNRTRPRDIATLTRRRRGRAVRTGDQTGRPARGSPRFRVHRTPCGWHGRRGVSPRRGRVSRCRGDDCGHRHGALWKPLPATRDPGADAPRAGPTQTDNRVRACWKSP